MNKPNIKISIDDVRIKLGQKYEFSHYKDFEPRITDVFSGIRVSNGNVLFVSKARNIGFMFCRPIQQKDLSAEELYRVCGREGFELRDKLGAVSTCLWYNHHKDSLSGTHISSYTHFRKAYSTDEWQPISELPREGK